ncbi:hypothetical protein Bbelb_369760 [Branchiostoma belcheri]|nr:hypothetical protein Bbelb_369760 [Branchiostoma belcheri]
MHHGLPCTVESPGLLGCVRAEETPDQSWDVIHCPKWRTRRSTSCRRLSADINAIEITAHKYPYVWYFTSVHESIAFTKWSLTVGKVWRTGMSRALDTGTRRDVENGRALEGMYSLGCRSLQQAKFHGTMSQTLARFQSHQMQWVQVKDLGRNDPCQYTVCDIMLTASGQERLGSLQLTQDWLEKVWFPFVCLY